MKKFLWERLNLEITIYEFSESKCRQILAGITYNREVDYKSYIVAECVKDFGKVLEEIQTYCISTKAAEPRQLLYELYKKCVQLNPLLDVDKNRNKIKPPGGRGMPQGPQGQMAGQPHPQMQEEKAKTFEDVPKEELRTLYDRVTSKVIGQNKAIEPIIKTIIRAGAGIRDLEQPIGCFLLTGPSGCGKTYLSKVLTDELIRDRKALIRIDCSEYSRGHEYAKLIGSPPGFVLSDKGGYLTNAIYNNPLSIVLFDEIEKAHEKVHNILLQIMDEAFLMDSRGFRVSFSDSVILLTSNIGVYDIEKIKRTIGITPGKQEVTPEKRKQAMETAVGRLFKPEFINRLDDVVHFMPLSDKKDCLEIIRLELDYLSNLVKKNRGISLSFHDSIFEYVYTHGFDERYGARPLRRSIKTRIADPLAEFLLGVDQFKDSIISVELDGNDKVIFS